MSKTNSRIKISMLLNSTVAEVFIAVAINFIQMVNQEQRLQALLQAESKARIMLEQNLATHTCFTHQLKPNFMELTDSVRSWDYFNPTWMSSPYVVREMDKSKNLARRIITMRKALSMQAVWKMRQMDTKETLSMN